jgi:bone morphogenetic protein 2/4
MNPMKMTGDIGERAEALEGSLLNMFGLKRRPRPGVETRQRIVVPEFLAELYRQQTGLEVDTTNLNLAGKLTQTANTVRTFSHQGIKIEFQISRQFQSNSKIIINSL